LITHVIKMKLKKGIKMFQTYRNANRKTWFGIDRQIKNNEIQPTKNDNKKISLLRKPEMNKTNNNITPTAEYVLAIREAVNKVKS